jgi:fibronectin type 3 domain-containing protein
MHGVHAYFCRIAGALLVAVTFLAFGSARAQGIPPGTAHSATLTWKAPSPVGGSGTVSGYNIYRSPSIMANYSKVNAVLNTGLTYTDTSISAGASYTYCVTTVDSVGQKSVCSAPTSASVPANPNAPSAPLITVK